VKKSTSKPASKSSCESKDTSTESDVKTIETLVKELQHQITELKSKPEALTAEKFALLVVMKMSNFIPVFHHFLTFAPFTCSVSQLNWGSDFKNGCPSGSDKCGPTRKL